MSQTPPSNEAGRLRPHPETRFAPGQIEVDLSAAAARIRAEPRTGERGHRQETLYRQGGLTIALFVFDRFTNLASHRAAGVVNMHILRGRMKITAEGQTHELSAGQMLMLAPGTEHSLAAEEESDMLLTVALVGQ